MMKLNAGDYTRSDVFLICPEDIIVDEKLNGRWQPHGEPEVAVLVKSFEQYGQLQPVQVRRVTENRVQLVLGYRRHKAAIQYNNLHPDNPMKLKCICVVINDEEALQRNIEENKERAANTPIDDAYNQRRLHDECGWTDKRIADFYRMAPSYVGQLRKLLTLPSEIQSRIHARELSVEAGLSIVDLPADEQKEALLPGDGGSFPTTKEIRKRVREKKIAKGGKQHRTLSEVREFLESLTGPAEPPALKEWAETMLKFISGMYTDKTMEGKLRKFLVAELAA